MKKKQNFNWQFIINQLGLMLMVEAFFMATAVFLSFHYKESVAEMMVVSAEITLAAGLLLYFTTKKNLQRELRKAQSFLLVTLTWVVMSLAGALPFILTGSIPNFIDALFESMSGFTTTGSSILTDIEALPKSVLYWRSLTHWIGGMGIVVLFVALFPYLKTNRIYLFQAEASVVVETKPIPKIIDIARIIWIVYFVMTLVLTLLLVLGGMPLFDSVCHSFGTVATGGFSTKNTSIADYSPYIQYVISVFMILAGINFNLYLMMLKRKFSSALKNDELKTYLSIIAVATIVITVSLYHNHIYQGLEKSFRYALFQVASIITATGYATADYLKWTNSALLVIVLLMLTGGSAGSTSGGIKVIRHLIFFRTFKNNFKQQLHSDVVTPVYYNKRAVKPEIINNILTFIIAYVSIILISTTLLTFMGMDIVSAFGSSATCIGGIGPGLGTTGPASNFSAVPQAGKLLLTFVMLIGRLEIFTVLVIFTKSFRNA